MSGRDTSLDVARFLAMLTIVFIHVRTNAPSGDYGFVAGLDNFITAVVLGLFVLISGYLSRGFLASLSVSKLVVRQVTYVWPVFTMMLGLGSLAGRLLYGQWPVPLRGLPHYVLSTGWFFFCLGICDALTFAAQAFSRGRRGVLLATLAFQFAVLWALPVGLCHAKDMILYFWFGLYVYPALRCRPQCRALGLASFVLCLLACVALPDFRTIGLFVHDAPMPNGTFAVRGCALVVIKTVLGLTGAFGTLEVIRLVTPLLKGGRFAGWLGTQTLAVFFIHLLLLTAYYGLGGWMGGGVAGRFALACALFAISHCLAVLTHMNAVVGAVLWNPLGLLKKRPKALADGVPGRLGQSQSSNQAIQQ